MNNEQRRAMRDAIFAERAEQIRINKARIQTEKQQRDALTQAGAAAIEAAFARQEEENNV